MGRSKEKFQEELKKCQLLCKGCHKEKNKIDNGEAKHGTISMYHGQKCRCDLCKASQTVYMREYRLKNKLMLP